MNTEQLLVLCIFLIPAIIAFLGQEFFKHLIHRYFENLSPKAINTLFYGIVVGLLVLALGVPGIMIAQEDGNTNASAAATNSEPIQPKSREEVIKDGIIEGGEKIIELSQDIKQHKEERQNEMIANKKTNWVYQIGGVRDKNEAISDFEKARGFVKIEILKVSKKEYLLFSPSKAETEAEMNDSISTIKEKLSLIEGRFDDNVYVINLPLKCKAKHEPVQQKLYFNKRFKEVSCYVCD